MTDTATISELRWQCRRGMLELDILLNNFVDTLVSNNLASNTLAGSSNESSYNKSSDNKSGEHNSHRLTQQIKQNFELLLSYPDQTLLDLLLDNAKSSNPEISSIVKLIQSTSRN